MRGTPTADDLLEVEAFAAFLERHPNDGTGARTPIDFAYGIGKLPAARYLEDIGHGIG